MNDNNTIDTKENTKNTPNVIICKNCGAKYAATEKTCPFCGYENAGLAEKEFATKVENIQEAIRAEKTRPQRFVEAFKKNIVLIVIICLCLIGFPVAYEIFNTDNGSQTYEVSDEYIEELEQARLNHDYETIKNLVNNNHLYKGKYKGYDNLVTVYSDYSSHKENLEKANDEMNADTFFSEENRALSVEIDIAWSIHYGLRALRSANEILINDTSYGTEEDIALFKDEIITRFFDWGIDEALISTLTEEMENDHDAISHDDSLIWNKAVSIADDMLSKK